MAEIYSVAKKSAAIQTKDPQRVILRDYCEILIDTFFSNHQASDTVVIKPGQVGVLT